MKNKKNLIQRTWNALVYALSWPDRALTRYRQRRARRAARRKSAEAFPAPKPAGGFGSRLRERTRKAFGLPEPGHVPPPMPIGPVKRSFRNRIRRIFGMADLVESYERPKRTLGMWLGAVPAALALVLLAVGAFAFDVSEQRMVHKYRKWAGQAGEEGNDARAELCLRRVAKVSISDDEKFRLIALELKRKQTERALLLIDEMASPDRQGNPRAHHMKARFLAEQGLNTPELVREYEAHLKFCLSDDSLKSDAHFRLGELYMALGRLVLAEDHLRKAAARIPDANLLLAAVCTALGRKEQAPGLIRNYLDIAVARLEANPGDVALRAKVANSYARLEEFRKALDTLDRAEPLQPSPQLAVQRARTLALYAKYELAQKNEAAAFRIIEQALIEFPNVRDFYEVLVKLAEGPSENAAEASARVEKMLAAGGPLSDNLHMLVALNASIAKDFEKARRHFDIVFKNNPNAAHVANNLAVALASTDPPQLDRALELANRAIDMFSRDRPDPELMLPQMRETRGQIYVKLKKWDDALADLEAAARALPGHAGTHQGLADTYQALGENSLAEQHRKLAERLNGPKALEKLPSPPKKRPA